VNDEATLAAVCGGVLILGFAGMLEGKRATTHRNFLGYLEKFTKEVSEDRIVEDDNIITARGVTSAIDLGLYLCERIAGREIRESIQQQMDYLSYSTK
jgi:cyclohexyl-isocyanide hydratase